MNDISQILRKLLLSVRCLFSICLCTNYKLQSQFHHHHHHLNSGFLVISQGIPFHFNTIANTHYHVLVLCVRCCLSFVDLILLCYYYSFLVIRLEAFSADWNERCLFSKVMIVNALLKLELNVCRLLITESSV